MKNHRRDSGFSLLELMAVLAILSVLSTVAIFSYKSYIRKARTGEGVAFLMDIKMKQETYFMTYSRYVDTGATPNDFFPSSLPFVPYPWVTGLGAWDCAAPSGDAMRGFCALGLSPTSEDTYFQYVTLGWAPGDSPPPGNIPWDGESSAPWIRDGSRRWWIARARGFLGTGTEDVSYEMYLSSEMSTIADKIIPLSAP